MSAKQDPNSPFTREEGVVHLGGIDALVRLTLALGGQQPTPLIVTRPAHAPLAGLAPGQAAAVAWQPRHASVLPPAA